MARRRVLEGVPKIAFAPIHGGRFELTPFPSALKAVSKYLGQDFAYPCLLGASGAAFRLVWHAEKWEPGNVDIVFMDENPIRPFREALRAAGCSYEILLARRFAGHFAESTLAQRNAHLRGLYEDDEAVFRGKIVESVDRGRPLIVLQGRCEVDRARVYRGSLEWVPAIALTPKVHEYFTGLRAYDAYMEKMRDDAEFPLGDRSVLARRKMAHYDAMTMIAERGGGADFVREAAGHPAFRKARSDLLKASEAFSACAAQMESWWRIVGQIWADERAQIQATADPEVRRRFVPYIEKARDRDREAVSCLERASSKYS